MTDSFILHPYKRIKSNLVVMKQLIILVLGIFFAKFTVAQFTDSTRHYVGYTATGVFNKTNSSSSYLFSNNLKFSARQKNLSLNNATAYVYGWQQKQITNNDFSSSLDFNIYKTGSHFYYWGLAAFDKSYSLKINNRLQAGLGAAYSFIDKENAFVNVSNGILYEFSNLNLNDSVKNIYHILRNSLRVRHRFIINKIISLDGTYFWQPSFYDKKDYILKSTTTLSVKLRKWLNLIATANYNKVNLTQRENLLMTFGISAEKYF
jgi:hypothetical protein